MEGGKPSDSSFTSDLFGAKDSSATTSSSSGIWSSIFPPPSKAPRGEPLRSSETEKKNEAWSAKAAVTGEKEQNWSMKENSSYLQEEKTEPCHYSSSIYYGGQDVYYQSPTAHNPGVTTVSLSYPTRKTVPRLVKTWEEKTTRPVLQEGTGGRDLFTTKSLQGT